MFAFAIYDITKQKTFLVRDETGIKPLYYSVSGEKLVFASEVKAFESLNYSYTENPDWKIYFLAFGHLPEPYTTYSEIAMLPKANYLIWNHEDSSFAVNSFNTEETELKANNENGVENEVRTLLKRSVERHLLSDAPIGVFLSGGVDSSIISLLAEEIRIEKNQKTKVNTLSINFEETAFSEQKYQEIISAKINSEHSNYTITNTFFHKHLSSALNAMDQPSTDGLNSWFVNYFAKKKGLKAVISGIGADELFGGYPSFNRMKTVTRLMLLPASILKKGKFFKKSFLKRAYYLSYKNTVGQYLFLRGICSPDEIAELLDVEIDYVDSVLSGINISAPKHLQSNNLAGWMEFNMYMQNQLLKDTDTMSMHHGVEVRIPFLDKDFARLIQSLPSEIKFKGHIKKWFLIKTFIKILPKAIWNRPKMGFTFPFQLWLQNENCLSNVKNQKASKFLSSFKTGKLHWSKALAIYIVFK
ncbi:MAG: asparagine synthase (glutamine-hydrolyzing) [Flavobacterium sp.]|nr:MAG: asparagine synthase (glutamine-hydrolyzing) [Flavobacterium sp.]